MRDLKEACHWLEQQLQGAPPDYRAREGFNYLVELAKLGEMVNSMPAGTWLEHQSLGHIYNDGPSWRFHHREDVRTATDCCHYGSSPGEALNKQHEEKCVAPQEMTLREFEDYLCENSVLDPESVANCWQHMKRELMLLGCLLSAGVNNWNGYADALKMMPDEDDEDE